MPKIITVTKPNGNSYVGIPLEFDWDDERVKLHILSSNADGLTHGSRAGGLIDFHVGDAIIGEWDPAR